MKLRIETKDELASRAQVERREQVADEARAFLARTDWMAIRAMETGKPIPEDIAASRADARKAAQVSTAVPPQAAQRDETRK